MERQSIPVELDPDDRRLPALRFGPSAIRQGGDHVTQNARHLIAQHHFVSPI